MCKSAFTYIHHFTWLENWLQTTQTYRQPFSANDLNKVCVLFIYIHLEALKSSKAIAKTMMLSFRNLQIISILIIQQMPLSKATCNYNGKLFWEFWVPTWC